MEDTKAAAVRPTKKQKELLGFIEAFIIEHGYSPSYREIMSGCEYTSVATVALHVNSLIRRGHLRKRDRSARSLEVVKESGAVESADDLGPAAWLATQAELFIAALEAGDEADADKLAEPRTLIAALRVLGLHDAADQLEPRLQALESAS